MMYTGFFGAVITAEAIAKNVGIITPGTETVRDVARR